MTSPSFDKSPAAFDWRFGVLLLLLVAGLTTAVVRDLSEVSLPLVVEPGGYVGRTPEVPPGQGAEREMVARGDRIVTIAGRSVGTLAEINDVLRRLEPTGLDGPTSIPITFERYHFRYTETLAYQEVVDGGFPTSIDDTDRVIGYDQRDVKGDIDQRTIVAILANRPGQQVPFTFERPVHRFVVLVPVGEPVVSPWSVLLFALAIAIVAGAFWRSMSDDTAEDRWLSLAVVTTTMPWAASALLAPATVIGDPWLLLAAIVGLSLIRPLSLDFHQRLLGPRSGVMTAAALLPAVLVAAFGCYLGAKLVPAGMGDEVPAGTDEEILTFLQATMVLMALYHVVDLVLWLRAWATMNEEERRALRVPHLGVLVSTLALFSGLLFWLRDAEAFQTEFVYHGLALVMVLWIADAGTLAALPSGQRAQLRGTGSGLDSPLVRWICQASALLGERECRLVVVRGSLGAVLRLVPSEADTERVDGDPNDAEAPQEASFSTAPPQLVSALGVMHDERVNLPLLTPPERVGEELAVGAGESVGIGYARLLYDEIPDGAPTDEAQRLHYVFVVASTAEVEDHGELSAHLATFETLWDEVHQRLLEWIAVQHAQPEERAVIGNQPHLVLDRPSEAETPSEPEAPLQPAADLPYMRRDLASAYPVDEPTLVAPRVRERLADADRDAPVIVVGSPGIGKELVARWYHASGPVADGPFIKFSVSSCPPSLRKLELIGDLESGDTGHVHAAAGGTLFVEDAGELDDATLDRLLHDVGNEDVALVLSVRCPPRVDTDDCLDSLGGSLGSLARGILAHRVVEVPQLGQDPEHLRAVAGFYIHRFAMKHNLVVTEIDEAATELLVRHDWLAGITELKSVLEAAVLGCQGETIQASDLRLGAGEGDGLEEWAQDSTDLRAALRRAEAVICREAVQRTEGNKAAAARSLGIKASRLSRVLKRKD